MMNEDLKYDYEREMLFDENGDVFVAVIWPTAIAFEKEILQLINEFQDVYLYKKEYVSIKKENLLWIMYWIYHFDWIPPKIVEEKCKIIFQSTKDERLKLTFLKIYSKDNNYSINTHNDRKQATVTNAMKYKIRQTIKGKIDNYVHDIIIHITDDGRQSGALLKLIDFLNELEVNNKRICGFNYDGNCLTLKIYDDYISKAEFETDWLVIENNRNGRKNEII